MRQSRTQTIAVLLLLALTSYLGWRAQQRGLIHFGGIFHRSGNDATVSPANPTGLASSQGLSRRFKERTSVDLLVPIATLSPGTKPPHPDLQSTNRLRNTPSSIDELIHNDRAILLRNALLDSANGEPLLIPESLRSKVSPEAYIVQSSQRITKEISNELTRRGAKIISYVPNNALLIQVSPAELEELCKIPELAAVLPLEPYFKLTPGLLSLALNSQPLPEGQLLILSVASEQNEITDLTRLGIREVSRERGPFGTLVTVRAPASGWIELAQIPAVHRIEPARRAKLANDLTAYSLGSSTNVENTNSYDGLTGAGVLINVNDSGVDASNPDLEGRVFTLPDQTNVLVDPDGHGTHVAGIIAGNGSQSGRVNNPPPQGSATNANFKGKAPEASLFVLPVDLLAGPTSGDSWLQETAAQAPQRFNSLEDVLISNNSWGYIGLDAFEYSSHSASYDAAVRDALPQVSGQQPILYVFSAGNEGSGGNNGVGGAADSILSPANAKNVVTVGALENLRGFTNSVIVDTNGNPVQVGAVVLVPGWETNGGPYLTNEVLLPYSDTDWQVASYSSRGNVGIGIEGSVGRYKPDVVAQGSFVASVRSAQWVQPPLPDTDDPLFPISSLFNEVNNEILPPYRFESGTSMAAPAVSGILAQIQEKFEYQINQYPSAAAYKALLINSAQPTSPGYIPNQEEPINYGGWGRPNLRRAVGQGFKAKVGGETRDILGLDASTGITTGQSVEFELNMTSTNAVDHPLRLTLVWTDPPGDPIVGPKLVNDLDLILSNKITGEVYWGNDFDSQTGFSRGHTTNEISTNGFPTLDRINNVEKIVISPPIGTNWVVAVVAHRVNVNSVFKNTNAIAQDFSLVMSSDWDSGGTNEVGVINLTAGVDTIGSIFNKSEVKVITNSAAYLNQRVGANSPLLGGTNGQSRQWQFYVFTNLPGTTTNGDIVFTNGSNVVFVTFPVGNLSRSRTNGPDIDLYVSKNPALTNLEPSVIAAAKKSTTRGGDELVYYIGEPISADNVFYVGVKSEDHEASEYGFVGISTDQPLTDTDENGFRKPLTIPLRQPIPDGSPNNPGLGLYLAISIVPEPIRAVYAGVTTTHENYPDLASTLSHLRKSSVLQNHTRLFGRQSGTNLSVIYDDTGSGLFGSQPSDGPGTLLNLLGETGAGAWFLQTVDDSLGYSGQINNLSLSLVPNDFGEDFVSRCIRGGFIGLEVLDVPPEASRMTVTVTNIDPSLPLEIFIKREQFPDIFDPANNDKYAQLVGKGGSVSIGVRDVPPLEAGRYFIAVYNPNPVLVCYKIKAHLERNLDASFTKTFVSKQLGLISDAAIRSSGIDVDDPRKVTSMDVGVRLNHSRLSDLSLRLSNPNGYGAVLFENRGDLGATNLGNTIVTTNYEYQHIALTYDPANHYARIYINGSMAAERLMPPDFVPATSNQFYFGVDPQSRFKHQQVKVDDFGLWKRALRPNELRDIYLRGVAGESKATSDANQGLVALWSFDSLNGTDSVSTNKVGLTYGSTAVKGQFPGKNAILIPYPSFGEVTNIISVQPGSGFTIEGWGFIPKPATNAVFAGWWGETSHGKLGPALVSSGDLGSGSVTAVMTDTNGNQILFTTKPNQFVNVAKVTNIVYATFSENTNRSFEKIKFVTPPFQGQINQDQVLIIDSFEDVAPGAYPVGSTFKGWDVVSNGIAILDYPLVAVEGGSHLMALSNSIVRRVFSTVPGEKYKVDFAARLASGETNSINPKVSLDGVSVTPPALVLSTNGWNTNITFEIRATKPTVVLEINCSTTPQGSLGMLIDEVSLIQSSGTISYLPEEPLKPLLGGGLGTWALEIDDGRSPNQGDLLDWQLTLTFAPASVPAVRLYNGVIFSTNVVNGDIKYFYIDVPLEASTSTNWIRSISGGPLTMWYNPVGLPGNGSLPEDYSLVYATQGNSNSFKVLTTNVPPVLVPGQRYYLSVANLQPNQSNQFSIQVDLGVKITPLTNGVSYTATNINNGLIDYYSFNVSTNSLGVSFLLTNLSDNLQLVARKGPQIPTRTLFDYASTNEGKADELILIDPTSQPTPLAAGIWYLGVYSFSTNIGVPITYTIRADEFAGNISALNNGVPLSGSITNGQTRYFYLDIDQDPLEAWFVLTNVNRSANLYLKKGLPLPTITDYDYASTNSGTISELIKVNLASVPVPVTQGRWYLAVVPEDSQPTSFEITGSYTPKDVAVIPLEDSVPFEFLDSSATNTIYFSFDVPFGTKATLFEIYGLTGTAYLRVSKDVLPIYASSTNIFTAPDPQLGSQRIAIRNDIGGNQLSGTWFMEVKVNSTNLVSFTAQGSLQHDGLLVSGSPITANLFLDQQMTITFGTVPGELYSVESTADLAAVPVVWTTLNLIKATGDQLSIPLSSPGPEDKRYFYRVVQVPQ